MQKKTKTTNEHFEWQTFQLWIFQCFLFFFFVFSNMCFPVSSNFLLLLFFFWIFFAEFVKKIVSLTKRYLMNEAHSYEPFALLAMANLHMHVNVSNSFPSAPFSLRCFSKSYSSESVSKWVKRKKKKWLSQHIQCVMKWVLNNVTEHRAHALQAASKRHPRNTVLCLWLVLCAICCLFHGSRIMRSKHARVEYKIPT